MSGHHHHDHEHEGDAELSLRVRALESLLLEKGVIASDAVARIASYFENDVGPMRGARVVAHAWTDPEYRELLLTDAVEAVRRLGYLGTNTEHLVAVENTPTTHNVVVCTLCSCYPWGVLGLPPTWYKDPAYRARVVIEPRQVLREFGVDLAEDVEIRVWDSSADQRYLVVPERPAGSERMTEAELMVLVTRDSMIGTARVELGEPR
jgi:nitrile hydratase